MNQLPLKYLCKASKLLEKACYYCLKAALLAYQENWTSLYYILFTHFVLYCTIYSTLVHNLVGEALEQIPMHLVHAVDLLLHLPARE